MYSVVRYVPDTTAGEFVNIGVLVWGDGRVRARFLASWRRIDGAPDQAVALLDRFKARFSPDANPPVAEREIVEMIDAWGGAIQFSPSTPAVGTPDETLEAVTGDFLRALTLSPRAWQQEFPSNPDFLRKNQLPAG